MKTQQFNNLDPRGPNLRALKSEMIEVLNIYIEDDNLHPQEAAFILSELMRESLAKLNWTPEQVSTALAKIDEAINLLKH
jgi:hypothetical protein